MLKKIVTACEMNLTRFLCTTHASANDKMIMILLFVQLSTAANGSFSSCS